MNPCSYGDGIVTDNSTDNVIGGNVTSHDGPYDGIALVDASKGNRVSGNQSVDNAVSNILPNGQAGPCGPEGGGTASGRPHQDMGIRIEGPGATANVVSANTTKGNQAAGISIHGTQRSIEPPNTANLVVDLDREQLRHREPAVRGRWWDGHSATGHAARGRTHALRCRSDGDVV